MKVLTSIKNFGHRLVRSRALQIEPNLRHCPSDRLVALINSPATFAFSPWIVGGMYFVGYITTMASAKIVNDYLFPMSHVERLLASSIVCSIIASVFFLESYARQLVRSAKKDIAMGLCSCGYIISQNGCICPECGKLKAKKRER